MSPKIRDRAYALVKKLKKAWTVDGCDIQLAVEQALVEQAKDVNATIEKALPLIEQLEGAARALERPDCPINFMDQADYVRSVRAKLEGLLRGLRTEL